MRFLSEKEKENITMSGKSAKEIHEIVDKVLSSNNISALYALDNFVDVALVNKFK